MSHITKTDTATTSSDINTKNTKYILLTDADSYLGRVVALYIADQLTRREGQLKKKHWRLRVLCEDKSKLKDLEKKGIEVKEVDYESQSTLREQMKDNIKAVIFNPFTRVDRLVHRGRNVIDAAVHEKIKRILMVSMMGCSSNQDTESPMGKISMIEKHLRESYKYGAWVVFRIPLIQQFMHFWSSMIENKSVIGMPMSQTDYLMTVNMKDVCDCISQAALSKKCSVWNDQRNLIGSSSDNDSDDYRDASHSPPTRAAMKRIYEITCGTPVNLFMISQALSDAAKQEGFDVDVEPATISDEQLEGYLKYVSEEKKTSIESHLSGIFQGKDSKSRKQSVSETGLFNKVKSLFVDDNDTSKALLDQDDPSWCPSPKVLNPFCIELILNHFRNARNPDIPMVPSADVRDITGRDPVELSYFFMKNRRRFHPE